MSVSSFGCLSGRLLAIVLLCGWALPFLGATAEPSPKPVFELIDARLSLMKDVARFKAQQGLAVEHKAREKVVVAKAQASASDAGLDPESVAAFYRQQIQAAKAIQYRYLADWTFDRAAAVEPAADLETVIRPALLDIGDRLVAAMADYLKAGGCFRSDHWPLFRESITVEHLTESEKTKLFESMSKINLTESRLRCSEAD